MGVGLFWDVKRAAISRVAALRAQLVYCGLTIPRVR